MQTCLKCHYTRIPQDDNFYSKDECPKCGVLYSKVLQRNQNSKEALDDKKIEEPSKEKENQSVPPNLDIEPFPKVHPWARYWARRTTLKYKMILSFSAGILLTALAAALVFVLSSTPSLQKLHTIPEENEFLAVSQVQAKVLDSGTTSRRRKDGTKLPRISTVQCRCKVENVSTIPLRFVLQVELLDATGFVLSSAEIDSNQGQRDIYPGNTREVYRDMQIEYARLKDLIACRITPRALKTDTQILQERQSALDEIRAKWKQLCQGMTKSDVQAVLGRPLSVKSYFTEDQWEYPSVEGTYTTPRVIFNENGYVKGWVVP